ncbi:hypothetical protein A9Q81_12300 [Gammaproteobacteria bacterium 42_54_T18]|nr:hypothetical protein A9Q81_12300 [Gammaproteobacteria bacterium 42_54_T18]
MTAKYVMYIAKWLFLLPVVVLFVIGSSAYAEEDVQPVSLFVGTNYDLNRNIYIFEDPTNELTIDQVSSHEYDTEFSLNESSMLNLGISQSTYWVKLNIVYPSSYPNADPRQQWLLEVGRSNLDIAELFIPEVDGVYTVLSSDLRSKYDEKDVIHVNSVFPITTLLDQEMLLYIKIKSDTSIYLPVKLWTHTGFLEKTSREELAYGVFLGAMVILLTYNFFIYVSVRDVGYLYYVFYLGSITIAEVLESGHGMIHVNQIFGFIGRENILPMLSVSAISTMFFAKNFMSTKADFPRLDSVLNFIAVISFMSAVIFFISDYHVVALWNRIYFTVFMLLFLWIIGYCWSRGNQNAKFLFFAWIFNVVGLTIFTGVTSKVIPATVLSLSALPLGILAEAILLSFALSNRIKNERAAVLLADYDEMDSLFRYESLFNNAREGMYKMSLSGEIISENPAMLRIFGFDNSRQLAKSGANFSSRIFQDTHRQFEEMLTVGISSNDLCFIRSDERKVWVHHSARVIREKSGKVSHIEGVVLNVTQLKLKEIAVREKEREYTEKLIAVTSTNAKSEFLANMSHEIRTPLTAIVGFSESLQEKNLTKSEKKSAIDLVVNNSHTLLHLINDILDFSKIEADKLDVEEIFVNVADMLGDIKEAFVARAEERGLRFDIVYHYPIPSVVISDPTRMYQVLGNLCENAIKFTEKGSVLLVVSWDGEINKLQFEVIDSGLGVGKGEQAKLFTVFDQADTSSTRSYGGVGLGLAISQKLAAMMDGRIDVLSEVNRGSVFTFTVGVRLPQNLEWIRSGEYIPSAKSKGLQDVPSFSGTVLLAEDNVVNQKLIERVLKKTGVSVIVVSDGVEACGCCDNEWPDFILMDINMPNRDGVTATRYLRGNGCTVPIYALTAETSKEEINKAIDAGCNGVLSKPLNRKLLYNAMSEFF